MDLDLPGIEIGVVGKQLQNVLLDFIIRPAMQAGSRKRWRPTRLTPIVIALAPSRLAWRRVVSRALCSRTAAGALPPHHSSQSGGEACATVPAAGQCLPKVECV